VVAVAEGQPANPATEALLDIVLASQLE